MNKIRTKLSCVSRILVIALIITSFNISTMATANMNDLHLRSTSTNESENNMIFGIPSIVNTLITDSSIELVWEAVYGASSYDVEIDSAQIYNTNQTNYVHTNLEPEKEYHYRVRATNGELAGEWSDALILFTQPKTIRIPNNIITVVSTNQITVSWNTIEGTTGYEIEVDGVILSTDQTSYTHTNLRQGTEHSYRVRGKDATGTGEWSNLITAVTKLDIPVNIKAQATQTTITLSWNVVENGTKYEIEVDGNVINNGVNTVYQHTNLQPNTQHQYRVIAKNSKSSSSWSSYIHVYTLPATGRAGTLEDPIIITDPTELQAISNNLTLHYRLGNDIDLGGIEWTPIGTNSTPFSGFFDGNGYTITNIRINKPGISYAGLFGYTKDATIKNVTLENVNINGENYIGSLAGYMTGVSIVENCSAEGGTVSGGTQIGGLIGYVAGGNVAYCSSKVNITGKNNNIGGLIGSSGAAVSRSYATGNITSSYSIVGGLIGNTSSTGLVRESYATGNVTGASSTGGLIGAASAEVENSFALGDVTALVSSNANIGGLIGYAGAIPVKKCYSVGKITSTGTSTNKGGLIGYVNNTTIISSYYDGITSQYTPAAPRDVSRLTTEMKRMDTFVDWNFNQIWQIDENLSYPYLLNLPKPEKISGLPGNDIGTGSGTISDPYIIHTKEQLRNIDYNPQAHYRLGNDIDLGEVEWAPIGTNSTPFSGFFDGNGYTITNIRINKPGISYAGLFGYTKDATIKNVTLENVNINGENYIGSLAGYMTGVSIVENCSAEGGTVSGGTQIGGLIGYVAGGNVAYCSSKVNITGKNNNIGGLIGSSGAAVSRSYATGNITSSYSIVGGLIGNTSSTGLVRESYATGNVTGASSTGGLIGAASAEVENSFALGDVTALVSSNANIGGLIGYAGAIPVKKCYSVGKITSAGTSTNKGGLIGYVNNTTIISSYYDGITSQYTPAAPRDVSRLTTEMKRMDTFVDWNFNQIWQIDENLSYPYLLNLPKPEKVSSIPGNDIGTGSGTISDPYIIHTKEQLRNIDYNPQAHYRLGNDIDLGEVEWTPIGTNSTPFSGSLDGNGYTITNIRINKPGISYAGLFGYTKDATIKNVTLENVNINGENYIGSLAGYMTGVSIVENCSAEGGTVSGGTQIGGLIGYVAGGNVAYCSSKVNITGKNNNIGGLIGSSGAAVSRSYATGNITSSYSIVGGLIGNTSSTGLVRESYATGNVTGASSTGGLIGAASAEVENSFALGDVTALVSSNANIGGLIGYAGAIPVKKCYSVGKITSAGTSTNKGGLIGYVNSTTIINSYFDSTTTGITTPVNQAKNTEQLKAEATFQGWNFNSVWNINENQDYPYLRSIASPSGESQSDLILLLKLHITKVTPNLIELNWEPIDDALSYDIEVDGKVISIGLETKYEHTSLDQGSEHRYRIRVKTSKGISPWGREVVQTTKLEVPMNLNAVSGPTALKISWDSIPTATAYDLELDERVITVTDTSFYHEGLTPDTEHTYRVRAKNAKTSSDWSEILKVSTLPNLRGIGTVEDPFVITNRVELEDIKNAPAAHYKLANDIDLENVEWTPIGTATIPFSGSLDGNGFNIKNLSINKGTTNNIGLFALINNATIKNVNIENVNISGNSYVGALVGQALGSSNIENCSVTGMGTINGANDVGGIVGYIEGAGVTSCRTAIEVIGRGNNIGGLIGRTTKAVISKCYTTGNVTSSGSYVGGLMGYGNWVGNIGSITESYAVGNVTGNQYIGGLIGSAAGGLDVKIENSFALGDVKATHASNPYAGGVAGQISGSASSTPIIMKNCYSTGKIEANAEYKGGFIGGYSNEKIISCYYDGNTSGFAPIGIYDISRPTSLMKTKTTFVDWNFSNAWDMEEGITYPYLRALPIPEKINNGMVTDPYVIKTREQLENIKYDLAGHYKLANDIDLENVEWTPIGTATIPFSGSLDGNGFSIKNLSINKEMISDIGLFAQVNNAIIKNINIENVSIRGYNNTGALVGQALGDNTIENCSVTGTGTVSGVSFLGGMIGYIEGGSVTNAYSTIEVTGRLSIQGSTIGIGGLIGRTTKAVISKSYTTGNVTSVGSYVGGLVGYGNWTDNMGGISESYAIGNVTGSWYVGGLVGSISGTGTKINNCFTLGDVKATHASVSYAGGVVGQISGSASTTPIEMKNCYSIGKIEANAEYKGGFIGGYSNEKIISCYYDGNTSGFAPIGIYDISRPTSLMKTKTTFVDWNFSNAWDMEEGITYPYLRALPIPEKINNGMVTDPYVIKTREQLENIKYDLAGHYKLANDIDLENVEWTPIGTATIPFSGSLDGNGFSIKNLSINKEMISDIGLFAQVNNAIIKNINIENVSIRGYNNTGALVGQALGDNTIENCSVTGTGTVSGVSFLGGMIGYIEGGSVTNAYSTIEVTGRLSIQGSTIGIGGLIGRTTKAVISKSYTTGNVTSVGSYVGGLVGYGNWTDNMGGISESYAIGNVTGSWYVGGLVGSISGTGTKINNCFTLGDVKATHASSAYLGGLVGYAAGSSTSLTVIIQNSYFAGNIVGNGSIKGGITCTSSTYTTITNSYFNSTTTNITTPAIQARTTNQLMQGANFEGWNFTDIWDISEGRSYPFLRALAVPKHVGMPVQLQPAQLTVAKVTDTSITLSWGAVPKATGYEIEADGIVVENALNTTLEHTELEPATEHIYRIRVKGTETGSSWSPPFRVMTLLSTPKNITVPNTNNSITIQWEAVDKATGYDVEVDGVVVDAGANTSYIHGNLLINSQHIYRIRAKNSLVTSDWSRPITAINWNTDKPAVCLFMDNVIQDIQSDNEVGVVVKAGGFEDMYTIQFEITYDPRDLELDTNSIKNQLALKDDSIYFAIVEDKPNGRLKVLISHLENSPGSVGQFDVVSMKFKFKKANTAPINIPFIKVVKSTGEYVEIPPVPELNLQTALNE